ICTEYKYKHQEQDLQSVRGCAYDCRDLCAGALFYSGGADSHFAHYSGDLHFRLSAGMEDGFAELLRVYSDRYGGASGVFRILRRTGETGGTDRRIYHRIYPHGCDHRNDAQPCEKQDHTVSGNVAWNRCLLCVWHSLVLRDHGFRHRGCHERLRAAFYSGRYHKNGRGPYNLSGNKKILEIRFLIAYNTIQVKENSSGQGDCRL